MPLASMIQAAGGILWRRGAEGPLVAVVHRPRHEDWGLPKGKLDTDERWQDAALREVLEETGYQAELCEFAGVIAYDVHGAPKIVLFWNMRACGEPSFEPGEEVDAVEWLPPEEAARRLDYEDERALLRGQSPP